MKLKIIFLELFLIRLRRVKNEAADRLFGFENTVKRSK
jgi:hypothetical protein